MKLRIIILIFLLAVAGLIIGLGNGVHAPSQSRVDPLPAPSQPVAIAPVADRAIVPSRNGGDESVALVPTSASMLLVDRRLENFGPALLRFMPAGGHVEARLYSDDPRDAITSGPTPNSFDFDMKLPNISDPAQIGSAVWTYKSPSSDRQQSPFGIMLNKQQELLQPMDVQVSFSGQSPNIQVEIQGVFWRYRTTGEFPSPPPEMVRVSGSLSASVPQK